MPSIRCYWDLRKALARASGHTDLTNARKDMTPKSWQGPGFCWTHGHFSHPAFYVSFLSFWSFILTDFQCMWLSTCFLTVECPVVGRYWCNVMADLKKKIIEWKVTSMKKIYSLKRIFYTLSIGFFKRNYCMLAKKVLPNFHRKKGEWEAGEHFDMGTICFVIRRGNRFVWQFCDLFLNFCFQAERERQWEREVRV